MGTGYTFDVHSDELYKYDINKILKELFDGNYRNTLNPYDELNRLFFLIIIHHLI